MTAHKASLHIYISHYFYNIIFVVFPSVQDPVTVSTDCPNGQNITANYEIIYASSSGTSNTFVNGTDCIVTCYDELQNNSTFSNESVTVNVTAENIVGSSISTSKLFTAFYVLE